jgi:calcium-dependent protein kinase
MMNDSIFSFRRSPSKKKRSAAFVFKNEDSAAKKMAISHVCSFPHQEHQQQEVSDHSNSESCSTSVEVEVSRGMTSQSREPERKMSCSDNSIEDLQEGSKAQTNVIDGSSIETTPMRTENDTREPPACEPLHCHCPPAYAVSPAPVIVSQNSAKKPRLTLSAFRRPEQAIRLTHSDPTRRCEDEYDLHASGCRVLGRGAFSTVRLAVRRSDGVKVAIKTIAKHDALSARRHRKSSRRHLDEWEILRRFQDHPNIITLLDVFETDDEILVLTEFCPGGELFDAIQTKKGKTREFCPDRYSEIQIARITKQILSALAALHSQSVVHRDVKPENILLVNDDDSDVSVKLCDFGVARCLIERDEDGSSSDGDLTPLATRPRRMSTVGSDYYIAPEVCFSTGYGTAVDVYSLGVTLYILLCGHPPSFEEKDDESTVVFGSSRWKNISEKAKSLIRRMLSPDPTKRITAADALEDEWIVQYSKAKSRTMTTVVSEPAKVAGLSGLAVDLERVRNELYKRMDARDDDCKRRERSYTCSVNRRKRRRANRSTDSSFVAAAMVDLYKDVAAAAASVTAAAAGVVCDDMGQICVFDEDDHGIASVDGEDVEASSFESPARTLSV